MELKEIKGLGSARIETLHSHNINSVEDLVLHFPRFYYDLDNPEEFKEDGRYKLIKALVISDIKVVRIRKNFSYSFVECQDTFNNKFKAIWYNQTYLKNAIKNGDTLYLYGKNSRTKKNYFIVSTYKNKNKINRDEGLIPIYKTYKNLGQSVLNNAIETALNKLEIGSIFPKNLEEKYFDKPFCTAIKTIHYPKNKEELEEAKERIDIENVMPLIKFNFDLKNNKNGIKSHNYTNFDIVMNKICSFLPYKLTSSQQKVLSDIKADMSNSSPMNRLVQGDVGAGKTVVAMIASAVCVTSGFTSILAAPTEILAKQHYLSMKKYFDPLGLKICFLSGSSSPSERARVLTNLKFNVPFLLVGTQAVLSDEIASENIALIIIDEQHRFGVNQRTKLLNKAKNLDLIMLSATPIPRSMSLVYYGSIDISKLDLPPVQKQIQTNIVSVNKENDMWNFIKTKIATGSKVYVVCANIDENDDDTYEGLSAKKMHEQLCKIFSKENVLLAHGKLSSKDEENLINKFKNGESNILVSTTIIEVGIDIKDADIMVIVSPEKFGLATLHQLRGRIGRAGQEAYCFCLSRNLSSNSYERIKYFKEHSDGFDIAEFDYNSRGAGSIYSEKQHGRVESIFSYVSLKTLEKAKGIFEEIAKEHDTDFIMKSSVYDVLSKISFS